MDKRIFNRRKLFILGYHIGFILVILALIVNVILILDNPDAHRAFFLIISFIVTIALYKIIKWVRRYPAAEISDNHLIVFNNAFLAPEEISLQHLKNVEFSKKSLTLITKNGLFFINIRQFENPKEIIEFLEAKIDN